MSNQEQYNKMIIPDELYTVDHNKALLNAARELKEHCTKIKECPDCQFYDNVEGCIIHNYPEYWEV